MRGRRGECRKREKRKMTKRKGERYEKAKNKQIKDRSATYHLSTVSNEQTTHNERVK